VSSQPHVVIIGGGLAGLAAAVALAKQNVRITLLESRPRLGGRATSIVDQTTGELIDNCQHVNMGCCVNFQQLCEWTASRQHLVTEEQLQFIGRDGVVNRLQNGWLPAPVHLSSAFTRFSYLNWSDKLCLARGMWSLMRNPSWPNDSLVDFLSHTRQTTPSIDRFWIPVLVSALSEDLARISYRYARQVFVEGFLSHQEGWKVQLLNIPLGQFYDGIIKAWLQSHEVDVRIKSHIKQINLKPDDKPQVTGVTLANGEVLPADHLILAVSFDRVMSLLPEHLAGKFPYNGISQIESAPITSLHFWFDRPITALRHAVLIDRKSQWMFNRTAILDSHNSQKPERYAYQIVISNSGSVRQRSSESYLSQQELIEQIHQELKEIWPETRTAQLLHARAITEHRAVFSVEPGIDDLRPPQQTEISNLQIAGDWTDTGWPATMEGAVRSGFLAAENVLHRTGGTSTTAGFLATELESSALSSLLIKNA
tara:strand:+ start:4913 stop:6358 length:1446 start_codon:yes stop_codon:yes gene_type:complete